MLTRAGSLLHSEAAPATSATRGPIRASGGRLNMDHRQLMTDPGRVSSRVEIPTGLDRLTGSEPRDEQPPAKA